MIVFVISKLYNDYMIGEWTKNINQRDELAKYSAIIYSLLIFSSLAIFVRIMYALNRNVIAAKDIHEEMIDKVMHAPINLYFEVTPIGRILNKFSKDLNMIDMRQIININ